MVSASRDASAHQECHNRECDDVHQRALPIVDDFVLILLVFRKIVGDILAPDRARPPSTGRAGGAESGGWSGRQKRQHMAEPARAAWVWPVFCRLRATSIYYATIPLLQLIY